MSLSSVTLPPVSSLSVSPGVPSAAAPAPTSLPSVPVALELTQPQAGQHIGPPQTSPVNLELAPEHSGSGGTASGNVTPTSEINEMTNSPPQSSPVNLAQSNSQNIDC